ncbi:MAG: hypothetical protein KBC64_07520 [Simkaniaceae bacterium]|nr:hypothetical protein [Simkaniaceae bacterium]
MFDSIIHRLSSIEAAAAPGIIGEVEEVSSYLQQLPTELLSAPNAAAAQDLINRVSFLGTEDVSHLRVLFEKTKYLSQFLQTYSRTDLGHRIEAIGLDYIKEVLDFAFPLIQRPYFIAGKDQSLVILEICLELSPADKAEICAQDYYISTGFAMDEILTMIHSMSMVPADERTMICTQCASLMEVLPKWLGLALIPGILQTIPSEERSSFCTQVLPTVLSLKDESMIAVFLRRVSEYPLGKRALYCDSFPPLLQKAKDMAEKEQILHAMHAIPLENRATLVAQALSFIENMGNEHNTPEIIEALQNISSADPVIQQEGIRTLTLPFAHQAKAVSLILKEILLTPIEEAPYSSVFPFIFQVLPLIDRVYYREFIIKEIKNISLSERALFCEQVKLFIREGTVTSRANLIKEMKAIPSDERALLCTQILPFIREISNKYSSFGDLEQEAESIILEIIKTLREIPLDEQTPFYTLASPFMDNVPGSIRLSILRILKSIPAEARASICAQALPLVRGKMDSSAGQILLILSSLPADEHSLFCEQASFLIEDVDDQHVCNHIMHSLSSLPGEERPTFTTQGKLLIEGLTEQNSILFALDALKKILPVERSDVCTHSLLFIKKETNVHDRLFILKNMKKIPAAEREAVCAEALPLIKGASGRRSAGDILAEVHLSRITDPESAIWKQSLPFMKEDFHATTKRAILYAISSIPSNERATFCTHLLPLIEDVNEGERKDMIELVATLPEIERAEFWEPTLSLIKGSYPHNIINIITTVISIPSTERQAFCAQVLPLVNTIKDRGAVIEKVAKLPEAERSELWDQVFPFIEGITDQYRRSNIIESIVELSKSKRANLWLQVSPFIQGITNESSKTCIIHTIIRFPQNQRAELWAQVSPLIQGTMSDREREDIITGIIQLPPDERTSLFAQALPYIIKRCYQEKLPSPTLTLRHTSKQNKASLCIDALPFLADVMSKVDDKWNTGWRIIDILNTLPPTERALFCSQILPFVKGNIYKDDEDIIKITTMLSQIPAGERAAICTHGRGFAIHHLTAILNILQKIPSIERALFCEHFLPLLQEEATTTNDIIDRINLLPAEEITAFCAQICPFVLACPNPRHKDLILRTIAYFAPKDRLSVLEMMLPLLATLTLDPHHSDTAQLTLIQAILSHNPALREPMHAYLIEQLGTETNPDKAEKLARLIFDNRPSFHLFDETDPLAQAALGIIIATENLTNHKNPYVVFKQLTDSAKKETPEAPYQEGLRLHPKQIFITARTTIPQAEVLTMTHGAPLTGQVLKNFVTEFRERVAAAPNQADIQASVYANNAASLEALLSNLKDPFFLDLLNRPYQAEISLKQAMMCSLIQYFLDLSNEVPAGALLSPREEALCKISTSIQNCEQGKSEGLALTYASLEKKYQYSTESDINLVAQAKTFVRGTLQKSILDLISGDTSLMRAMTQSLGPVSQLSHQSTYVKNFLGPHMGMPHALQFDLHTHILYDALLGLSLEEAFSLFYDHFTVKTATTLLREAFERLPKPEQAHIFNGTIELLGSRIKVEDIFDLHEETYEPSLTEKGALEFLLALGIL